MRKIEDTNITTAPPGAKPKADIEPGLSQRRAKAIGLETLRLEAGLDALEALCGP